MGGKIGQNLIGKRFGHLTVVAKNGRDKHYTWKCFCDCGNTSNVQTNALIKEIVKSCGCRRSEGKKTHGKSNTKTYATWMCMRRRCKGEMPTNRKNYFEKGIKVCERWENSFENFFTDMGERPEGMTLDRIDNNGNYSPENCRWATHSQQIKNSSQFKLNEMVCKKIDEMVDCNTKKYIIAQKLQLDVSTVYAYLRSVKRMAASRESGCVEQSAE